MVGICSLFRNGVQRGGSTVESKVADVRQYEPPSLVFYGTISDRTAGTGTTSADSCINGDQGQDSGHQSTPGCSGH